MYFGISCPQLICRARYSNRSSGKLFLENYLRIDVVMCKPFSSLSSIVVVLFIRFKLKRFKKWRKTFENTILYIYTNCIDDDYKTCFIFINNKKIL